MATATLPSRWQGLHERNEREVALNAPLGSALARVVPSTNRLEIREENHSRRLFGCCGVCSQNCRVVDEWALDTEGALHLNTGRGGRFTTSRAQEL